MTIELALVNWLDRDFFVLIVSDMDASELIDALGGANKVATMIGVTPAAVRNWKVFGVLPPKHYLKMRSLAEDMGLRMPEALFAERANGQAH
jgi:hypothetical protein